MSALVRYLQGAAKAGGRELRLVPGRRLVLVLPGGEREVQGQEQTGAIIDSLLEGVLTPEARLALSRGRAEWSLEVAGVGRVRAWAESGPGGTRAGFGLGGDGAPAPALPAAVAAPPSAAAASPPAAAAPGRDPAVREIEELLTALHAMKGSDLHVCAGSPPLVRHDGAVQALPGRAALSPADTERILLPLAPPRHREEFQQRHDTDFAHEIPGVARFRVNFFRDRRGMGAVFRVIPTRILTAQEMGLPREILDLCHLAKGLVLVTGPTGSGKSTTLTALVDHVNEIRTDHIITIEDPIEFVHENKRCLINQRQVGEHTGSFKAALRAALREDPDIVLVGEMRDLETVAIAIETAETGHLVFGTLHTSSAVSTVDRIIDQFPADRQAQIRVMLSESLKGVISQTLCRRIGGGRVPALEVLIVTPPVANLIREAKTFQVPSIMQTGRRHGMVLMNDALLDLVRRKVVEPREAWARAADKNGLLASFRKNGIDTAWAPSEAPPPAAPGAA
jgi:twitching motility protein PilT